MTYPVRSYKRISSNNELQEVSRGHNRNFIPKDGTNYKTMEVLKSLAINQNK